MHIRYTPCYYLSGLMILVACGDHPQNIDTPTELPQEQPSAAIAQVSDVPKGELNYSDVIAPSGAKLKIGTRPYGYVAPTASLNVRASIDHNKLTCDFHSTVQAFDLGVPTRDAGEREVQNSSGGQCIHVIVNNRDQYDVTDTPYVVSVARGRNYVLSFLARSYGESVKSPDAFQMTEMVVAGDPGGEPKFFWNSSAATLFYYRPYGEYKLGEGAQILLDFYLLNCTPAPQGGYTVRATIDGEAYILTRWAPYYIEGLASGEHTIRLELLDPSGKLCDTPYSDSGMRTFTVVD